MNKNIYVERGYKSRAHYLQCLAEDYGVAQHELLAVADLLGPAEDFDGLITAIEDMSDEDPEGELIDLPNTIPFKMGTHLMHPHSGKEVIVERDNGGATVYVAFLGTGRTQSIPRGALVSIDTSKTKEDTKKTVSDIPSKPKKDKVSTPYKLEIRDFMAEINISNYTAMMKSIFNEDIKYEYDPKTWGRTKMQMGNKIRALLVKKELTGIELWDKLFEKTS